MQTFRGNLTLSPSVVLLKGSFRAPDAAPTHSSSLEFSLNKRNPKLESVLHHHQKVLKLQASSAATAESITRKEYQRFHRCFSSTAEAATANEHMHPFKSSSLSSLSAIINEQVLTSEEGEAAANSKQIAEVINYNSSSSSSSYSKFRKKKQLKKYSKLAFPKQNPPSSNSSSDPSPPPPAQANNLESANTKLHEFKPVIERIKKQLILSASAESTRRAKLEAVNLKASHKLRRMRDKLETGRELEQGLRCRATTTAELEAESARRTTDNEQIKFITCIGVEENNSAKKNRNNQSFDIDRNLGESGEEEERSDCSENQNIRIIKLNLKGRDTTTRTANRNTVTSSSCISQREEAEERENLTGNKRNKAILITSSAITTYSLQEEEEAKSLESCCSANNPNPIYCELNTSKAENSDINKSGEEEEELSNSISEAESSNRLVRSKLRLGLAEPSVSALSMKRSKMSMNLAGIEPYQQQKQQQPTQEEEARPIPDTISTTHTTSSRTTRKTTKFTPFEEQNADQSEQANKPATGITSILRNFNSASTNPLSYSGTLSDQKSVTVETRHEKQQRFVLEERTNTVPLPTKISSLKITPARYDEPPLRYIDDIDEDPCDRIVPRPRPDSSLRSGLKESIDRLDKLIDTVGEVKSSAPEQSRRSEARPRLASADSGNSFHPTWDEWKQRNTSSSLNRDSERLFSAGASRSAGERESASRAESRHSKTQKRSEYSEEHTYKSRKSSSSRQESQVSGPGD